jgi:hypothetical protein
VTEHNCGFCSKRSAHQAVAQAQRNLTKGYRWVADINLGKFFDRVNHDKLMGELAKRITVKRRAHDRGERVSLGIPEKVLSGADLSVYGQGFSVCTKKLERLVHDGFRKIPHVQVRMIKLGRLDSAQRKKPRRLHPDCLRTHQASGSGLVEPHGQARSTFQCALGAES